jgi:hypothetical protein
MYLEWLLSAGRPILQAVHIAHGALNTALKSMYINPRCKISRMQKLKYWVKLQCSRSGFYNQMLPYPLADISRKDLKDSEYSSLTAI